MKRHVSGVLGYMSSSDAVNARKCYKSWLWPLALACLAVLSYSNTFGNGFIFDDARVTAFRSRSLRPTMGWLNPRGLVQVTFLLNHAANPGRPEGYHAVNLVIHMMAGLTLYSFLRRTFLVPLFEREIHRNAAHLAGASAALWIVHPLQTETVAYIAQRSEAMTGFFLFLTLYSLARYAGHEKSRIWGRVSVLACFLAMWCKETAVVIPVLAFLYDFLFIGKSLSEIWRVRRGYYAMLALSWIFLGVLMLIHAAMSYTVVSGPGPAISRLEYFLTQMEVIPRYLTLAFWPAGLCMDYAWPPVQSFREVALPAGFLGVLAIVSLWAVLKQKPAGFPGAWFFVTLAPSSSIIPLTDLAFEHRMYLPLAAITTGAVVLVFRAWYRGAQRAKVWRLVLIPAGWLVLLTLIILMTHLTRVRNLAYRDPETMARDVLGKCPRNFRQRLVLAAELQKKGSYTEAEHEIRSLIKEMEALKNDPLNPTLRIGANDVVGLTPHAFNVLGLCLMRQGKTAEARCWLEEAIALHPFAELYHNLAVALAQDGKMADAAQVIERAIDLNPNRALSLAFRGFVKSRQGLFCDAVESYRMALERDPSMIGAKVDLAWLLATAPDPAARNGAEALAMAIKLADETGRRNVRILDVLAAACAECGRWEEALITIENAIKLAAGECREDAKNSTETIAAELHARRDLYLTRQPYREGDSDAENR